MTEQQQLNYERIAGAIQYMSSHFKEQPTLEDIARHIHLSPFHFQKLFTEWAGTSPKKFMQYLSIEYAKKLLKNQAPRLSDAAYETGLSGSSRLHDLFISIEGMTPAEYRDGGKNLLIQYSFAACPFGNILTASTAKGICHLSFYEDQQQEALSALKKRFPLATFAECLNSMHTQALQVFSNKSSILPDIKLHLKGSPFQLKVWQALLQIPMGGLSTYGRLAGEIENPAAARAVGTAIGSNPVAFLIPCHRVIQASGIIGGYMWGQERKTAILGWEAAHTEPVP